MNVLRLVAASLRHYRRTALGVAAAVAVATAVLMGALTIGQAARTILRSLTLLRIGRVEFALATLDRFFRATLADDLELHMPAILAPVLLLQGTAVTPDHSAQAAEVRVLGVDRRFWQLSPAGSGPVGSESGVVLNTSLARQLGVKPGSEIILRLAPSGDMPSELRLSFEAQPQPVLRLTVSAIASDAQFGRFNLYSEPTPPLLAFLPLPQLQASTAQPGRANLLLTAARSNQPLTLTEADRRLKECLALTDLGYVIDAATNPAGLDLRSSRVFIEPSIDSGVRQAFMNAIGVLTYFVNEIRAGTNAAPYSMVAALPAAVLPVGMPTNGVVLTRWLADDLQARPGQDITLRYFVLDARRKLAEQHATLRVAAVWEMDHPWVDESLARSFPGLNDVDNCRDWQPGLPIDLTRIRPRDEAYWHKYRATPKAFISLEHGQALWRNDFGGLTAIRLPDAHAATGTIARLILDRIAPASLGFQFRPLRAEALASTSPAQDFGQLFLGLSFFLLAAALILTSLFWGLHISERLTEIGTLQALGFTARRIRHLMLAEGLALALLGALAGVPAGLLYARLLLRWLGPLLQTTATAQVLRPDFSAALIAVSAVLIMSYIAIRLVLRYWRNATPHALLSGTSPESGGRRRKPGRLSAWIGVVALAGAALIPATQGVRQSSAPELFFLAGFLALAGIMAFSHAWLGRLDGRIATTRLTIGELSLRNAGRRRWRSLAAIGLMASGTFLLIAVGANRRSAERDPWRRASGTGGFPLYAQGSQPVTIDLNSAEERRRHGLDRAPLNDIRFVACRVHAGDDASCLSPVRARVPTLVGVPVDELEQRKAFGWPHALPGWTGASTWERLATPLPDGTIPAVADETTLTWGLGLKLGDTTTYRAENGDAVRLRIVAALPDSILQGRLIVAENQFLRLFPGDRGARLFLIDAPRTAPADLARLINRQLFNLGLSATPAADRLQAFAEVENTYLAIFQSLGSLGLMLGVFGLGVVVLRNAMERRGELALLRAVGYRAPQIAGLLIGEYLFILGVGLAGGVAAGLLAIIPALRANAGAIPWVLTAVMTGMILLSGLVAVGIATLAALRQPMLPALREE